MILVYLGGLLLTSYFILKKDKKIFDDMIKIKYFKENRETLNKLSNQKQLVNVSEKTISKINKEKDKEPFDINVIDFMSLDDLKQIKANIETTKEFDLEKSNLEVKGKSRTLRP